MGFRLGAVFLLFLLRVVLPSSAQADPVLLTDGALVGDNVRVTLDATGQDGLSITAFGDRFGGNYGPSHCSPCLPGDLLEITSVWSDNDFPGVASIGGGKTFSLGGDPFTGGSLFASFDGQSVPLPNFAGETLLSISAPFSFDGLLFFPPSNPLKRAVDLGGAGTATIQLAWAPVFNGWELANARYEFSAVPEPASVILLGFGLACMGAWRWRERRRRMVRRQI
jgi:PEP-CTERM motif